MKRFLILSCVAMTVAGVGLLVGCDDDDNGTNPQIRTGDTTDAQFQVVRTVVLGDGGWSPFSATDTTVLMTIGLLDTVLQEEPGATRRLNDYPGVALQGTFVLAYHPETQYWYRFAQAGNDSVEYVWEDSLQLVTAAGPVQFLDTAQLLALNTGARLRTVFNSADTLREIGQQLSLAGSILTLGDIVLNGLQTVDAIVPVRLDTSQTVCRLDLNGSIAFNNIAMNLSDVGLFNGCPTGGSLTQDVMLDAFCLGDTALNFDGQWRFVQTFYPDSASYMFESNRTRWAYSNGSCRHQGNGSSSPINWSELRY